MNFLYFFSLYIQKKYDLCRIDRQIRDKEKLVSSIIQCHLSAIKEI